MAEIRLNKWLAEALGVSRREADEMILAHRVQIRKVSDSVSSGALSRARLSSQGAGAAVGLEVGASGPSSTRARIQESANFAELGARINSSDVVLVDEEEVRPLKAYTYLAMNKPVGYVSSRRAQGSAPTLYELLPEEYRSLKTVGRLDKDSSGLILLTDDGDFAHQMTHPSFAKMKVYEAELDRALEPLHQQMIADIGLDLKDGVSKMGLLKMGAGRKIWKVMLEEGRNRQIRRTFGALGYTVIKLHRVRFGKYELGGLRSGKFEVIRKAPLI